MKPRKYPAAKSKPGRGAIRNEPDPLESFRAYVQALPVSPLRSLTLVALGLYQENCRYPTEAQKFGLRPIPRSYE